MKVTNCKTLFTFVIYQYYYLFPISVHLLFYLNTLVEYLKQPYSPAFRFTHLNTFSFFYLSIHVIYLYYYLFPISIHLFFYLNTPVEYLQQPYSPAFMIHTPAYLHFFLSICPPSQCQAQVSVRQSSELSLFNIVKNMS